MSIIIYVYYFLCKIHTRSPVIDNTNLALKDSTYLISFTQSWMVWCVHPCIRNSAAEHVNVTKKRRQTGCVAVDRQLALGLGILQQQQGQAAML